MPPDCFRSTIADGNRPGRPNSFDSPQPQQQQLGGRQMSQQQQQHHNDLMDSFDEPTRRLVNGNTYGSGPMPSWKATSAGMQHRAQLRARLVEALEDKAMAAEAEAAEKDIYARAETQQEYSMQIAQWLAYQFQKANEKPEQQQQPTSGSFNDVGGDIGSSNGNVAADSSKDEDKSDAFGPLSVPSPTPSRPSLSEQNPMLSKLLPAGDQSDNGGDNNSTGLNIDSFPPRPASSSSSLPCRCFIFHNVLMIYFYL